MMTMREGEVVVVTITMADLPTTATYLFTIQFYMKILSFLVFIHLYMQVSLSSTL